MREEGLTVYDFQKAGMWKRISAALLDLILLLIVATGMAWMLSAVLDYDGYVERMEEKRHEYEERYDISLDVSAEDIQEMPPEKQSIYIEANEAFGQDPEAIRIQNILFNSALIITVFSILLGYLLLEFFIPLILKNGQTLGKKAFGIGVMRMDGIRVPHFLMFVRTVLGKCTVETLVPALILVMSFFGIMGFFGFLVILALLLFQIILIAATRARTPIHDLLAQTVTVDFASQMIFDTPEELLAYKKRIHAETVESQKE